MGAMEGFGQKSDISGFHQDPSAVLLKTVFLVMADGKAEAKAEYGGFKICL